MVVARGIFMGRYLIAAADRFSLGDLARYLGVRKCDVSALANMAGVRTRIRPLGGSSVEDDLLTPGEAKRVLWAFRATRAGRRA